MRWLISCADIITPNITEVALLLDEPFSALDYKLRRAMQLEIKRLQRRLGITFVFVTHDQEEAFAMSDRVVVMNQAASNRSARLRKSTRNRPTCTSPASSGRSTSCPRGSCPCPARASISRTSAAAASPAHVAFVRGGGSGERAFAA